ncbi:recombinase family protein [Streptomyces sp. NPDC058961]|uniref:recombinase family protein n=1 Tax=Streptomyces sp. NPDC058961 TaxID=3346680 RepID=UPI0036A89946
MTNLVYKRVSTDEQSNDRQTLVLAEAGIDSPVEFVEDPGTSSRLHPLQRPKFSALLDYAREGDTIHISEMFRLVRGNRHVLDVLDVLHTRRISLRIHDGAFSAMDLTARHPRTGELLATVKFMVQTLAAAGELQRDLQRELTFDGLRAAAAKGNTGGRRPAVGPQQADEARAAFLAGKSIASLARDLGVSRGAVRTAVADLLPDYAAPQEVQPPVPTLTLDVPGLIADHLQDTSDEEIRAALSGGTLTRRGLGFSLRVCAPLSTHRAILDMCWALAGGPGVESTSGERKAYSVYASRVEAAQSSG